MKKLIKYFARKYDLLVIPSQEAYSLAILASDYLKRTDQYKSDDYLRGINAGRADVAIMTLEMIKIHNPA